MFHNSKFSNFGVSSKPGAVQDASIPLLILADQNRTYRDALSQADSGDYQPFVDFVMESALDAMLLVEESFKMKEETDTNKLLRQIESQFVTSGGYDHNDVDNAAINFAKEFQTQLESLAKELLTTEKVVFSSSVGAEPYRLIDENYRMRVDGKGIVISYQFGTPKPVAVSVNKKFQVEIPRDAGLNDDIIVRERESTDKVRARVSELLTEESTGLRMRLQMYADRKLKESIQQLALAVTSAREKSKI